MIQRLIVLDLSELHEDVSFLLFCVADKAGLSGFIPMHQFEPLLTKLIDDYYRDPNLVSYPLVQDIDWSKHKSTFDALQAIDLDSYDLVKLAL